MRIIIWFVAAAILVGVGVFGYMRMNAPPERLYRTAAVKRTDVLATINATGTVEPEEVVDIGAQVAGRINAFGKDKDGKQIDYGSVVEADMMLAQIDDSLYASDLAQAKAQLEVDRAGVIKSQADLLQLKAKLEQTQADQEQSKAKLEQTQADQEQSKGRVDQAQADAEQFKGKLAESQANLGVARAKYEQAKRDWERAKKIGPSDALSQESYDTFKGVFETAEASVTSAQALVGQAQSNIVSQNAVIAQAKSNLVSQKALIAQAQSSIVSLNAVIAQAKANVASGDAAIKQAQGTVAHDEAVVQRAEQNVGYCTIKSPVKGVIIDRRVNIGQTVVSSLNAPSLFLLAKDLTKMQVWISVNEADIGNIHQGQAVTFSVDAFAGQVFKGSVRKIRLNATMTQNVVTFTVEVETDNSNGKLLPYLTANANFEVARHNDVLTVPNAALRFSPTPAEIAPDVPPEQESPRHAASTTPSESPATANAETAGKHERPDGEKTDKPKSGGSRKGMAHAKVWIKDGIFVRPIAVRTGITDGVNTEVQSSELTEGMEVVTGKQAAAVVAGEEKSPFAPQMGGGRRQQPGTTSKPSN